MHRCIVGSVSITLNLTRNGDVKVLTFSSNLRSCKLLCTLLPAFSVQKLIRQVHENLNIFNIIWRLWPRDVSRFFGGAFCFRSGLRQVKGMISWNETLWLSWSVKHTLLFTHKKKNLVCYVCILRVVVLFYCPKVWGLKGYELHTVQSRLPIKLKVSTWTFMLNFKPNQKQWKPFSYWSV